MGSQIRFWKDAYKNVAKSAEAGIPIFDTVPFYEVRVLGERDNVKGPWHKAPDAMREEWAAAFKQWEADNSSEGVIGTPLAMVPWLETGDVETLKYAGIKTLENLAAVTDGAIGNIPGGLALRQKAKDALRAAKEAAPIQRMSEELAKRDEEIASLKAQMAEILEAKRKKAKE